MRRSRLSTSCPTRQIRQELSALSGWPTIPQIFIKGELVGGADIVEELYESGELQAKLDEALGADREAGEKTAVRCPGRQSRFTDRNRHLTLFTLRVKTLRLQRGL